MGDKLREQLEKSNVALEEAAAELDRLHEVNADLVEALSTLIGMAENFADELSHTHPVVKEAKAALAKAQGENNDAN